MNLPVSTGLDLGVCEECVHRMKNKVGMTDENSQRVSVTQVQAGVGGQEDGGKEDHDKYYRNMFYLREIKKIN